jgi:hypothetical protein
MNVLFSEPRRLLTLVRMKLQLSSNKDTDICYVVSEEFDENERKGFTDGEIMIRERKICLPSIWCYLTKLYLEKSAYSLLYVEQ